MVFKKGDIPWNKGIYSERQTREYHNDKQREWYHKTKFDRKDIKKDYTDRIKLSVFSHYSPTLECNCCYESEYEFLTIDHENDKSKYNHPKTIQGGWNLINWIYQNNYPEGFKILCWNCNSGRGKRNMNGICPHKLKQTNDWEWEL